LLPLAGLVSCKSKKKMQKTNVVTADTLSGKCRLDHKSAKTLIKHQKENAFDYTWIYAKADVHVKIDSTTDEKLDVRIRGKKDSAILISIDALSLVSVAKVLITRDSVKMRVDLKKQYFKGDFNYINELLNADLDFDMIQAVLFGNAAEFYDEDETKLKSVTDRQNCRYLLVTERKRKRRNAAQQDTKSAQQTMTLNPDNYKILMNEFIDVTTNRIFTALYDNFATKDSVYAPHHVNIDIQAEKKVNLKIEYVRIEKDEKQNLNLNIPAKYDPIPVKKQK